LFSYRYCFLFRKTAQALEFARTQGFTYSRAGAPNIAFVITDGYSSNKTATHLQVDALIEIHVYNVISKIVIFLNYLNYLA
jgi:hypothetical protein